MTVAQLIETLRAHPLDAPVIVARDAEGNSHSPLSMAGGGVYVAEESYRGETYVARALDDELRAEGYSDEDCYDGPDAVDAVILVPTY
jgi:hypothetical protein